MIRQILTTNSRRCVPQLPLYRDRDHDACAMADVYFKSLGLPQAQAPSKN